MKALVVSLSIAVFALCLMVLALGIAIGRHVEREQFEQTTFTL